MKTHSICIFFLTLLTACSGPETTQKQEKPASSGPLEISSPKSMLHITIYVKKDGRIFLNRKMVDFKSLDEAFKAEKQKGCLVFYSRDDQNAEPHKAAIQVMDLIAKHDLPVQFYTDNTFTQLVQF